MPLQSYPLDLFAPPCAPGAERWSAKAALDDDIGDALPYLNATIKRAIYNHAARARTWRRGGHTIAARPREIAISNLLDKEAAAIEMKRIVDLSNRTWERRAEITPRLEMRQRLKPREVYQLLPATKCRECDQPTCFTFALKITAGEVNSDGARHFSLMRTAKNTSNCSRGWKARQVRPRHQSIEERNHHVSHNPTAATSNECFSTTLTA